MKNSNYFFPTNLKYAVLPCTFFSNILASTSLFSRSLVRRSVSPTSSLISAAGSHGFIDRILMAIKNSLSVCGCSLSIMSLVKVTTSLYICFACLVTNDVIFIYFLSHMTGC